MSVGGVLGQNQDSPKDEVKTVEQAVSALSAEAEKLEAKSLEAGDTVNPFETESRLAAQSQNGESVSQDNETTTNPFDTDGDGKASQAELMAQFIVIFAAILSLITRVQAIFFPKAGMLPTVISRFIAVGIVLGGFAVWFDFASHWDVIISFVISAAAYEAGIKKLMPTPKPLKS